LLAEYIGPYYVYLLVDPADNDIFYVGKGTALRFMAHLDAREIDNDEETPEEVDRKHARIDAIHQRGQRYRVEFARIKIPIESEAFRLEATLVYGAAKWPQLRG
jgi:hypothetical protein